MRYCTGCEALERSRFGPAISFSFAYTLASDGAPEPARSPPSARHECALLDRVRKRRLVDLLRARTGGVVCARAHAGRVRGDRRDLLPDRGDVRGGDRDVPRGGWVVELRAPRVQRAVVVLRGMGADAQL